MFPRDDHFTNEEYKSRWIAEYNLTKAREKANERYFLGSEEYVRSDLVSREPGLTLCTDAALRGLNTQGHVRAQYTPNGVMFVVLQDVKRYVLNRRGLF